MNSFKGFSPDMPFFLHELHFNNNIGNQAENLRQYKNLISEPLALLYEALIPTVQAIDPHLEIRPSKCISTPYTDRRFSQNVPLKEYMYIRFRETGKADNIVGLYFDMGDKMYSYGLRIYKQNAKGMETLREKIADAPELFSSTLDSLYDDGFKLIGSSYKTDKCPFLPDSSAKNLYNMKSFYVGKEVLLNENVFCEKLCGEISDAFIKVGKLREMIR